MKHAGLPHTRVVIAEDHAVVAEGIEHVLMPYFTIVGRVHRLRDLLAVLHDRRPDVAVLDISFGAESSLPLMRRATTELALPTRFVMLTAHESRALATASFEAGAHGFVVKGSSGQDLRLAIEAAAAGRRFTSPSVAAAVPEVASESNAARSRERVVVGGFAMSRRQLLILTRLSAGQPRQAVARALGLTVKGVDYNIAMVKRSTGVSSLIGLLRWFAEHASNEP